MIKRVTRRIKRYMERNTGQMKQIANQYAFELIGMVNWVSIACLQVSHITDLCFNHKDTSTMFTILICSSSLWNYAIPTVINIILTYSKICYTFVFVLIVLQKSAHHMKCFQTLAKMIMLTQIPRQAWNTLLSLWLWDDTNNPVPRHGLGKSLRHAPFCSFI